jgi:hypothetical protein
MTTIVSKAILGGLSLLVGPTYGPGWVPCSIGEVQGTVLDTPVGRLSQLSITPSMIMFESQ